MKVGDVFKTNTTGDCKVVSYLNSDNVTVEFINTGFITNVKGDNLIRGKVKDYLHPSVYGVGILGQRFNKFTCDREVYTIWRNMLKRCYSTIQHKSQPTYTDCSVSESFKNFEVFEKWCKVQTGFKQQGFQLDKDILIKGNNVYSEDTCCFVPKEVNLLLVNRQLHRGETPVGVNYHKKRKQYRARCNKDGVNVHLGWFSSPEQAFQAYKKAKETYIKEVANKWKDQIDPRVYEALMKYEVEITD